jgi:hypothetical protein
MSAISLIRQLIITFSVLALEASSQAGHWARYRASNSLLSVNVTIFPEYIKFISFLFSLIDFNNTGSQATAMTDYHDTTCTFLVV